jgi:cation diffusion facilitator family transporter
MHSASSLPICQLREPSVGRRERGVLAVVLLTATTMLIEIAVGYATSSMALLADGWHMATHVGALGLASIAYAISRRYATHRAFVFGTGKVHALAGYTNALGLGSIALIMVVECVLRLLEPHTIDFVRSLPVAVLGLVVNLVSVALLHAHGDEGDGHVHGDHGHHDDHNHRAAFMHVVADTLTSALAIVALLAGRLLGWVWLDAISGVVGGLVILKWSIALCQSAGTELLDLNPSSSLDERIRAALEAIDDVRVSDLHVWSLGGGARSCIVTVISATPREAREYRERLLDFRLAHLTVEVQRCVDGHAGPRPQP